MGVFFVKIAVLSKQAEHTSHFVDRAAGELEEVGEIIGRIAAGTFSYVVGDTERGSAQLFGKALEFALVQLFSQCE